MKIRVRDFNFRAISFYIIFFLFILASFIYQSFYDFDLWARLIAGEGFLKLGHVIKHDFLSYTPTHLWYDHEWGSGVIFYLVHKLLPNSGFIILQSVLIFLVFFIITKIVKLRGVKTTHPYNFLFYYFAFSAIFHLIEGLVRCQVFSFLFFTLFLYLLELSRAKDKKYLIYLPIIMIIWNNLHGGCVSGIGLVILYAIGEFFNTKSFKEILPYIYATLAMIIVLPINPWGVDYLRFLFQANTMQRTHIAEWMGLFSSYFIHEFVKFRIYSLIVLIFGFLAILKQVISKTFVFDTTKYLVLSVTLYLAIIHIKLVPFAMITMISFLYDDFYTIFNYLTRNIFNKIAPFKDSVVYLVILIFVFSNINSNIFKTKLTPNSYPIYAVDFISKNNIKGNLFANFGLSSYIDYKLYPNNKIFIDGRYEEVYPDYLLALQNNFYVGKEGWKIVLSKYPPDIILLEKSYGVFDAIKQNKQWKLVYEDNAFGVFVKKEMAQKQYLAPSYDDEYYRKTLFDNHINYEKLKKDGF